MLENVAWNTFENTGNIEAYIFYKELSQLSETKTNIYKDIPTKFKYKN